MGELMNLYLLCLSWGRDFLDRIGSLEMAQDISHGMMVVIVIYQLLPLYIHSGTQCVELAKKKEISSFNSGGYVARGDPVPE